MTRKVPCCLGRLRLGRLALVLVMAIVLLCAGRVLAAVRLPHIFGDNMVLQRGKPVRVWGWAERGETVTVAFGGQTKTATAGDDGTWECALDAMPAAARPGEFTVKGKAGAVTCANVLVGDVWVLGGQSNMEAALRNIRDGDLEVLSADLPAVRLMTVPLRAGPAPLDDFPRLDEYNAWSKVTERKGEWCVCSPETVTLFSAVGYVFGRRIHLVTKVPIGLIDTSWGGTTVEAWISRDTLKKIPEAAALLQSWDDRIAAYDPKQSLADQIKQWEARAKKLKDEGKTVPPRPTEPKPGPAVNRNNPGASYNAIIAPFARFAVKGALFYQGINNAVGGAMPKLYARTFAALVPEWRRTFGDEALPFGICQMVSWGFPPKIENTEKDMVSAAPYIREAQLKAHLAHPDTGFVVACDLGHIQMHSPFKTPLGERLARWALATQYGVKVDYRTPIYQSMTKQDNQMVVTFDVNIHPRHGGRAEIEGFAVAGEDRHFYPAQAFMASAETVKVWSDFVPNPVAVRYAWATHPFGTLVGAGSSGLPTAPFRTDDWPWQDAPVADRGSPEHAAYGKWLKEQGDQADRWARERALQEAKAVLERN
ncbi:MAG TPA: sialate O-acetylesterase [Phycisphaerae bacterium]|nr:sialate O-acetylesterase [Phycisphaerae bacterium]